MGFSHCLLPHYLPFTSSLSSFRSGFSALEHQLSGLPVPCSRCLDLDFSSSRRFSLYSFYSTAVCYHCVSLFHSPVCVNGMHGSLYVLSCLRRAVGCVAQAINSWWHQKFLIALPDPRFIIFPSTCSFVTLICCNLKMFYSVHKTFNASVALPVVSSFLSLLKVCFLVFLFWIEGLRIDGPKNLSHRNITAVLLWSVYRTLWIIKWPAGRMDVKHKLVERDSLMIAAQPLYALYVLDDQE